MICVTSRYVHSTSPFRFAANRRKLRMSFRTAAGRHLLSQVRCVRGDTVTNHGALDASGLVLFGPGRVGAVRLIASQKLATRAPRDSFAAQRNNLRPHRVVHDGHSLGVGFLDDERTSVAAYANAASGSSNLPKRAAGALASGAVLISLLTGVHPIPFPRPSYFTNLAFAESDSRAPAGC